MSSIIYLEGGGESKELQSRCRAGFRGLLERCGFSGRKPRLFASGGRGATFDDFRTALGGRSESEYIAMWIDSEEPMADTEAAWTHLQNVKTVPQWDRPNGASDDQVLFMTTCMETWIVTDRAALRKHYGNELQEGALPPLVQLEQRGRQDVQDALIHATGNCSNVYAKGTQSFEILGKLRPEALEEHLPSFVRVRRILNQRL